MGKTGISHLHRPIKKLSAVPPKLVQEHSYLSSNHYCDDVSYSTMQAFWGQIHANIKTTFNSNPSHLYSDFADFSLYSDIGAEGSTALGESTEAGTEG